MNKSLMEDKYDGIDREEREGDVRAEGGEKAMR